MSSNNEDENHMQDIVSGDTEQNIPFKEFTINLKAVMDEVKLLKSELRKLQIEVQETNIHDSELISCKVRIIKKGLIFNWHQNIPKCIFLEISG